MKAIISTIFFVAFIYVSFSIQAQIPVYKNYTISDGLPSSNVYSISQDDKGFIWFATDNGVSRFDGTIFKNFSIKDGLSDNSVLRAVQDLKGRIWFLTFSGKLSFYFKGKIYNSSNNKLIQKINLSAGISSFNEDSKGNIWIGSYDLELIRISPDNEVKYFHHKDIKLLWRDKDDNMHGLAANGLYEFGDTLIIFHPETFRTRFGIFLKDDSLLLLGTYEGLKLYKFNSILYDLKDFSKYNGTNISGFYKDNHNNIWLSTLSGAVKFDSAKITLKHFHSYLPYHCINFVFQDRNDNYWFCTAGNGVFMIPSLDIISIDNRFGLVENNIKSLCVLDDGSIMVGTHGGSIQIIEPNNIKKVNQSLLHTPSGSISKILKDQNKNIWVLTDETLFKFSNGNLIPIKDDSHWYKSIFVSKNGTCWIGKGRALSKIINNEVVNVSVSSVVNRIYSIASIDENELWLGTDKGLYIYKDGKMAPYETNNNLLSCRINALRFAEDSTLWIGTDMCGLISLRGNKISNFTSKDRLLSDKCNNLLIDEDKIYYATDNGFNVLSRSNNDFKITSYSSANGLLSNHIHEIIKKSKNIFLLATDEGIIEFNMSSLSAPASGIPYINEIFVNDESISLFNSPNLHYYENSISFSFSSINFNTDRNTNYRYKLIGVDTGWSFSAFSSVKYSYLRSGNYKFVVTDMEADGNWNINEASFSFYIETPWWETWWFRTLAILAGIISAGLIIKWRTEAYRKKINQQRALLESELKALRAQINPHFIFNSLNSIQDFIMLNQKEDANLYLTKFASLMRAILSHSRAVKISLDEEIKSLQLYLELESLRFEKRFTFHFDIDKEINVEQAQIPSMILQPYIENAILHGLASVEKNGKITIGFALKNNVLVCTLEDNGIGRKKSAETRKKQHPSLGMKVTEERIDLLSAYQKEKINLEIVDLVDEKNIGCGTRVIISFP